LHFTFRERVHSASLPPIHFVNRVLPGRQKPTRMSPAAPAWTAKAAASSIAAAKMEHLLVSGMDKNLSTSRLALRLFLSWNG
jgi:hypothetical protein